MTEAPQQPSSPPSEPPVAAEVVAAPGEDDVADEERGESIDQPAKVLRIGSMTKQLLEEVRAAPLDDASRTRLRDIYETSVRELADGLSPDLRDELARLASPFASEIPSDAELRIAQAQLVGWLEGLFHGIQATLYAQQAMAQQARAQVEGGRRAIAGAPEDRSGTYL